MEVVCNDKGDNIWRMNEREWKNTVRTRWKKIYHILEDLHLVVNNFRECVALFDFIGLVARTYYININII